MAVKLSEVYKAILFEETGFYSTQDRPKITYANCEVEYLEDDHNSKETINLIDYDEFSRIQDQYINSTEFELDISKTIDKYDTPILYLIPLYIEIDEYDEERTIKAKFYFYQFVKFDNTVKFDSPYSDSISYYDNKQKAWINDLPIDPSFQIFGLNSDIPENLNPKVSRPSSQISKDSHKEYYLFFDVESNGLPNDWNAPLKDLNNWPRIVQLAWILYNSDGKILYQNESIIKPDGFRISSESEEIHGISDTYANEHGKELFDVLMDFNSSLIADRLIAHNLNFDRKVLGAEYLRVFSKNPLSNLKGICTMKETTEYCSLTTEAGNKWPKLDELYFTLFGSSFENKHNAKYDVQATAKCFWELRKRGVL